jgi:hypothetical protein
VGVTRRDTFRPGFADAVRAANDEGYPVLVRSSGGGATAADAGTFGFSIIRPAAEESGRGIPQRYDEAAALVLGAFSRLGLAAEVGEVRDEFCPGDHSVRVGGWEHGMKLCGIAQRVTKRATSVGGIVLVEGEGELARVLEKVYGALGLPFPPRQRWQRPPSRQWCPRRSVPQGFRSRSGGPLRRQAHPPGRRDGRAGRAERGRAPRLRLSVLPISARLTP